MTVAWARHTCWGDPKWDGTLADGCAGCDDAEAHPCTFCGYGHVFTTHNPEPHAEGNDPILAAMDEAAWMERFGDVPYAEAPGATSTSEIPEPPPEESK